MEKVESLFTDLKKASEKLQEAHQLPITEINRDGTIQRFEFTFELFWKLLQAILTRDGIEAYGPRNAFREAGKLGLIDDVEKWLEFLTARNLTVHTYNEKLAQEIYNTSKDFLTHLNKSFDNLENYLTKQSS